MQLSSEALDNAMTGDRGWKRTGRKTGETYLVGPDSLMRLIPLAEDPGAFTANAAWNTALRRISSSGGPAPGDTVIAQSMGDSIRSRAQRLSVRTG